MVHASRTDHPDLFWGLRGGGGNFGVVTAFEFQLHPVGPTVLGGARFYPLERASDVLGLWREFALAAPHELTMIAILRKAPASPAIPTELHGVAVIALAACYAGPVDEGRILLAPLDVLAEPLVDLIMPRPYVGLQSMFDASWTPGFQNYWKAEYLARLDDATIDVLVDHAARITSPLSDIKIAGLGGALTTVPRTRRRSATARPDSCSTSTPGGPTLTSRRHTSEGHGSCGRPSGHRRPAGAMSTSSATKAQTASAPPTARPSTGGSWRSKPSTTPPTAFATTRTSRRVLSSDLGSERAPHRKE